MSVLVAHFQRVRVGKKIRVKKNKNTGGNFIFSSFQFKDKVEIFRFRLKFQE